MPRRRRGAVRPNLRRGAQQASAQEPSTRSKRRWCGRAAAPVLRGDATGFERLGFSGARWALDLGLVGFIAGLGRCSTASEIFDESVARWKRHT